MLFEQASSAHGEERRGSIRSLALVGLFQAYSELTKMSTLATDPCSLTESRADTDLTVETDQAQRGRYSSSSLQGLVDCGVPDKTTDRKIEFPPEVVLVDCLAKAV